MATRPGPFEGFFLGQIQTIPQAREFKYCGILFTSGGKTERELDWEISVASAIMQALYRTVVVRREQSWKVQLLIYQSICIPTLTYAHEKWVTTEKLVVEIQILE